MAILKNGYWLKELPASLMSEEFCRFAVNSYGKALEFVPRKFKTKELFLSAVKQDGHALKFVDVSMLTKEEYTEICRLSLYKKVEVLSQEEINMLLTPITDKKE
jgi:hypothetical protein